MEQTLSDVSILLDDTAATVKLITNKDLPATDSITLLVTYDPDTVIVAPEALHSSYPLYPSRTQDGQYLVTIQELGPIPAHTPLLTITPEGESNQIALSDVVIHFTDGTSARLAVGVPSF